MKSVGQGERHAFLLRSVCVVSFLISLFLAFFLAFLRVPAVAILQTIFVVMVLAAWWLIPYLHRRKRPISWFLTIAVLNILFVAPELGLWIKGFRYESGIQFGWPRPTSFRRLRPDDRLLWIHDPSEPDVNSWGFREREISHGDKPANINRVLFLGDSCTRQGYPGIAEVLLNAAHPEQCFECISLAVSGYSSFQGSRVAEMYGRLVNPDIVVVLYGWNDHWQAYGAVDSQKDIHASRPFIRRVRDFLLESRFVQFLLYVAALGREDAPLPEARVSLHEYETNLMSIYAVFEQMDTRVVFVTAPTSHYTLGVPHLLIEMQFLADEESDIRLHQEYNDVVRKVQRKSPLSVLCDLEAIYREMPPDQLKRVFKRDGIHFTERGLALVARDVSQVIEQAVR